MADMQNSANYMGLPDVPMSWFVDYVKTAVGARLDLIQSPDEKISSPVVKERLKNALKNTGMTGGLVISNTPFLGLGKPGIGKTEVMRNAVAQSFKTNSYGIPVKVDVKEIRLGSFQDTDLTGLPQFFTKDTEHGQKTFTEFAPLMALPITEEYGGTDSDFGILVLDEITACSPAVRTIALQLLDSSRSLAAGYKLPDGWTIVALGNGENDGADFMGFKATHISRFHGFNIMPDSEMWFEWARRANIHGAVYGFLKSHGEALFTLPPETMDESAYQFATPRTWEAASKSLLMNENKYHGKIPEQHVMPLIAGHVGIALGAKVAAYYKYKKDVIPLDEILDGTAMQKHTLQEIKIESLYLGQSGIIREILDIGKRNEEKLASANKGLSLGVGKSTFRFGASGPMKSSKKAEPLLANGDDVRIANIFKFIFWCENARSANTLDWINDTITNLKERSDDENNKILTYIIDTSGPFASDCPEFQKFASKHADLMKIVRFGFDGLN